MILTLGVCTSLTSCATPALWEWAEDTPDDDERPWAYATAAFLTPLSVAFDTTLGWIYVAPRVAASITKAGR